MTKHQATMIDTSRPADAGLVQRAAEIEHSVQFYEDEAFLYETIARFVGSGLLAGDAVVLVITEPHWRALVKALEAKGFAVDRTRSAGLLTVLDAQEMLDRFMVGGVPDWERFRACIGPVVDGSSDGGQRRVRLFGEMVDLLWREGNPQAALRLEELWNQLGKEKPFSLLCAYLMGNFFKESHGEEFQRVCETHRQVSPAESYSDDVDRDRRLREIAILQQRARALETELRRRNELEEALRYAREQAEAASTAKDEFLAMLGHELRNPSRRS